MKHEGRASGAGEGKGGDGMQSGAKLRWQKNFGSAAKGEREGERGEQSGYQPTRMSINLSRFFIPSPLRTFVIDLEQ